MDFELIIKDFFNNVPIDEIVKKYNIKYTRLCGVIRQYCVQNNIDFNDEIQAKLELPLEEIYAKVQKGIGYSEIGKKYGCSGDIVKNHLVKYCTKNNLLIPKVKKIANIPIIQIYEEKQKGVTYQKLGKEYGYSKETIRRHLKGYSVQEIKKYQIRLLLDLKEILIKAEKNALIEYKDWLFLDKVKQQFIKHCEYNNINISSMKIRIELPMNQIYKERQSGIEYRELGKKYDYTHEMIRQKLIRYCKQTGLEYPEVLPSSEINNFVLQEDIIEDMDIPIFKMSDELKTSLSSKENNWFLLNELKQEFIKHCEDNNIDISKLKIMIELPIEQIYQERQEGISYRKLGHKYGYTYEGIRKSLKKYCMEQNLDYLDDITDNQVVYTKK